MSLRRWPVVLALVLVIGVVGCRPRASDLDEVEAEVRTRFPDVRQLETAALADWLEDEGRPAPLLLDVREPDEFAVSHLPGAIQVPPGDEVPPSVLALARERPVVVYCSVGYRSSRFARALAEAGFEEVWNLEGSVFAWANERRPLVGEDGEPVARVHPYDRTWGRLVEPPYRAELP